MTGAITTHADCDEAQRRANCPAPELHKLLVLARQGLLRAVEVETILYAIRNEERIAELAPRGGELVSSCLDMMEAANRVDGPELRLHAEALSQIFDFLAQHLYHALELLAYSWRSERLREEQHKLGPLGKPGERLRLVASDIERLASERNS
ncbi:MAG: hypothetical protein ACJ77Z_11715 [Thermoleophilaceae bacterium]